MQYFRGCTAAEVIAVRLDPGDDVLESFNRLVSEAQLQAGAIVSGCGNLEHMRLEVAANLNWPPAVYATEKQGPGEIVAAGGHIANGYAEVYLTVARRNELHAGKVMQGTRALHFAEFTLLRAGNARWMRVPHPQSGAPLLHAQVAGGPQVGQVMLMGRALDPSAIALVPKEMIRRYTLLPVGKSADTIVIAMTDPNNPFAIDDVRQVTGLRVQTVAVPAQDLLPAIQQVLGS